jgi:hypothetical protein
MLIKNWKQAYKMHSVQLAAIVATVAGLEPFIPQLAAFLPDGWASVAAVLIVVARLASQNKLHETTPKELWDEAMRDKDLL